MGKGDMARMYKYMSAEDQRTFDRWLKANTIISLIFATGLIAMAFAGSTSRRTTRRGSSRQCFRRLHR